MRLKEQVVLVDDRDNETGTMEKMEAHKKAVLHRAVSVFISNSNGKWLIQRRALNKYHSNGLWTNTCCSHPFPGENIEDAANRRLQEEMGMTCNLNKVYEFIYREDLDNELTEHEYDHVFAGVTDEIPVINTEEVVEWKYISFDDLKNEIENHPEMFTVWFKKIYREINFHLNEIKNEKK